MDDDENSFVSLKGFEDIYEIMKYYPNVIRKKSSGKILKETLGNNGYFYVTLKGKQYLKHRIIAQQFIPNPNNLPIIDHMNRIKTDNRIENLRWTNNQENQLNRATWRNITYIFVDSLPEDITIEVTHYNNHEFEFYYFNQNDNNFYFFNGAMYRQLYVKECNNRNGLMYVTMINKQNKKVNVYLNKFMREYDLI